MVSFSVYNHKDTTFFNPTILVKKNNNNGFFYIFPQNAYIYEYEIGFFNCRV